MKERLFRLGWTRPPDRRTPLVMPASERSEAHGATLALRTYADVEDPGRRSGWIGLCYAEQARQFRISLQTFMSFRFCCLRFTVASMDTRGPGDGDAFLTAFALTPFGGMCRCRHNAVFLRRQGGILRRHIEDGWVDQVPCVATRANHPLARRTCKNHHKHMILNILLRSQIIT
jgi:hypothetical protein